MNIQETYNYLVRARRDLWTALESISDEVLSRQLLNGDRFHCIKDLVLHIPDVEDGWIHQDILRDEPVQKSIPSLTQDGPACTHIALEAQLNYWRLVEQSTLQYLATLTEADSKRVVILHDSPEERFTVDGLLWHVMIHEMRHTAQIAVLLRTQDIKPPSLDLLFYLPSA